MFCHRISSSRHHLSEEFPDLACGKYVGYAREYVWQNLWDKLLDIIGEDPFTVMYYGVLGILDYLHGTDKGFRASKEYERHIMLLGSKPLRETFPDVKKDL